jgi:hypothetical protein
LSTTITGHLTLERVVRWLKPSATSFAAAAAIYGPDLLVQLEATPSRRNREVPRCPAR